MTLSKWPQRALLLALAVPGSIASAQQPEPVRIAIIEISSGPFAGQGRWLLNQLDTAIEDVNRSGILPGGARIEAVRFDSKGSPQEALLALKQATDMGARFIVHGLGSHVAHALSDAVVKHNARDPQHPVLYLNYSALDPALTNEKCNFWHFRFDTHADMKLEALVRFVVRRKDVRRVYLVNQDYAYGQGVRRVLTEMLNQRRPDIEIVGDDLVPLGKVKDFAPYVSKIAASGAQAVLTSNWGNDLNLLIRASEDVKLPTQFLTLHSYIAGTPTAIGAAGADRLWTVAQWHSNAGGPLERYALAYKKRYKEEWAYVPAKSLIEMLARAVAIAGSTDPIKVAKALEGMRYDTGTGPMWMRADDHQLTMPQYVMRWTRAGSTGVKYDVEDTGYGFRTELRLEAAETTLPTTCRMQRPQ